MATRTYDKMPPSYTKGVQTYRWVGLGAGDYGMPAQGLAKYTRKTIEVTGTSPSVTIEGRLGTGTWKVLETISSADIRTVEENVDSIRPIVAGGTTVVVLLQVVAPNSPMLLGEDTGGGATTGNVTFPVEGGLTFPAGQILAPDGTVAAPSYSFASDHAVGLFWGGPLYIQNPSYPIILRVAGSNLVSFGDASATGAWSILSSAAGGHLLTGDDNARDLGGSGFRPRSLYVGTSVNFAIPSVPGTPAASTGVLYMKADKKLYFKNDAGVETALF